MAGSLAANSASRATLRQVTATSALGAPVICSSRSSHWVARMLLEHRARLSEQRRSLLRATRLHQPAAIVEENRGQQSGPVQGASDGEPGRERLRRGVVIPSGHGLVASDSRTTKPHRQCQLLRGRRFGELGERRRKTWLAQVDRDRGRVVETDLSVAQEAVDGHFFDRLHQHGKRLGGTVFRRRLDRKLPAGEALKLPVGRGCHLRRDTCRPALGELRVGPLIGDPDERDAAVCLARESPFDRRGAGRRRARRRRPSRRPRSTPRRGPSRATS